jgi:hypothetical protein
MTIRTFTAQSAKEQIMRLGANLLVAAILLALICVLPVWPNAGSWSYGFGALVGVLLLILLGLFAVIVSKVKAAVLSEPRAGPPKSTSRRSRARFS